MQIESTKYEYRMHVTGDFWRPRGDHSNRLTVYIYNCPVLPSRLIYFYSMEYPGLSFLDLFFCGLHYGLFKLGRIRCNNRKGSLPR